jgi:hypothetical protein
VIRKYLLGALIVLAGSASVQGQSVRSPFSTFGIGEPYGNALIQNQGMGGIGVSQPQFWFLNNQNPALLVYNNITVFQAGAMGESRTTSSDTLSEKNISGNMNYLATAFPVKFNKWSTSLGLMPYTAVNYNLEYLDVATDNETGAVVDTVLAKETGTGGLTQFYWGNGVRINKQWAVGLKAAYIFGPIENNYINRTTNTEQATPFLIRVREKTVVKDFLFTAGLSFSKDSLGSKNQYRFSAGATYSFKTKFNADSRAEVARLTLNETVIEADTIESSGGTLNIPQALTLGFSFSRGSKWAVGTEFTYQDWSSFESVNNDDEGLDKSWRAALGGEMTPDILAGDNYLKRITYRAGVSFEKYPFIVAGNPVNDFGINFGFSLPAGRSSLDLAFKVGKRGDKAENRLEENYFKVYFGITFNDQWFIKRKFD